MNNKYLYGAIAVVIILVGVFFYAKSKNNSNVASDTNTTNTADNLNTNMDTNMDMNTNADSNVSANANANSNLSLGQPDPSTPEPAPANPDGGDVAVFEVTYDGTSFSPSSLTIKNGDVVTFKNNSSTNFWPASDPHPTHTNYPEFDAKKAIAPGGNYQFKFTKSGTWGFHNHLNPSAKGTITVK